MDNLGHRDKAVLAGGESAEAGWHLPWDRRTLEERVRRMVSDQVETPKIDAKRSLDLSTKAAKVELVKDISAMANTDDGNHHDDHGFIIFGAEAGAIVGGVALLGAGKVDNTSASISQLIDQYLGPTPRIHLIGFMDDPTGPWGVLVIPPSGDQPHIFIKASDGPKVGDWLVRINDTTSRATPADYVRVLSKATSRAVGPFERKLQELESRLAEVERWPAGVQVVAPGSATRAAAPTPVQAPAAQSTVERLRAKLAGPEAQLDDAIVQDALSLSNHLESDLPWAIHRITRADATNLLDQIESMTQPVARSFATIARYDQTGRHLDGLERAARLLARIPRPGPSTESTDSGVYIRAYPFVLCLYSALATAIRGSNPAPMATLLGVPARIDAHTSEARRAIWMPRVLYWAGDIFQAALPGQKRHFIPCANRLMARTTDWTAELLLGDSPRETYFVTEFLITLLSIGGAHPTDFPIPGLYLYAGEACEPIRRFLVGRPDWLQPLFPEGLRETLAKFDASAHQMLDRHAFHAPGFLDGAVLAYGGQQPSAT